MSEQLVPATPVVEQHTQQGSRYVCVGLDALSAADELVLGVAVDLQQVIAKMKQAANVKYAAGVKFGTDNKAVLHTYIQVSYFPVKHPGILLSRQASRSLTLLLSQSPAKHPGILHSVEHLGMLLSRQTSRYLTLPSNIQFVPSKLVRNTVWSGVWSGQQDH